MGAGVRWPDMTSEGQGPDNPNATLYMVKRQCFFIVSFKKFLFWLLGWSLGTFERNETERLTNTLNQTVVKTKDKAVGKIIYSKPVTTQYKAEHFS